MVSYHNRMFVHLFLAYKGGQDRVSMDHYLVYKVIYFCIMKIWKRIKDFHILVGRVYG